MFTALSSQTRPLSRWSLASVQLTTLYRESRSHSQPIVERTTGAAQGRTTRKRMIHLPRKSRTRKFERTAAPTRTTACEASVKMSVFRSARRKFSSSHAFVKLSKPTQLPVSEPPMASVKLR